jgi:hypothetical protein
VQAKRVFGAGKEYADGAGRNAQGCRDLGVRIARMAQEQALTLPLRYFGQRAPNRVQLLLAEQMPRRPGEVLGTRGVLIRCLQLPDAFESRLRPFGGSQPIERKVQRYAPQPRAHFRVWSTLHIDLVVQLQEDLLQHVFGLHAIAKDPMHQPEHFSVETGEQDIESGSGPRGRMGCIEGEVHAPGLSNFVAIHLKNTAEARFSDSPTR